MGRSSYSRQTLARRARRRSGPRPPACRRRRSPRWWWAGGRPPRLARAATEGTAEMLRRNGIDARAVAKLGEGRAHVGDLIERGEVALIVNTPAGSGPRRDGDYIRTAAVRFGVPCITTMAGLQAAVQ